MGAMFPKVAIVLDNSDEIFAVGGFFRAFLIHDSLDILGVRFDSFPCYNVDSMRNLL